MCIFSEPVKLVNNTKIFARRGESNSQFLAYAMDYEAQTDLAMILPLPTPVRSPEDSIRFIDLSLCPKFFEKLQSCFPTLNEWVASLRFQSRSLAPQTLKIHEVGSFVASFLPTISDFERLDPQFRLDKTIWHSLPIYADYGFAVFKLKAGTKTIHPIAFEFPTRDQSLFLPTVHVHNGTVPTYARFDHSFYIQSSIKQPQFEMSDDQAGKFIDSKMQGIWELVRPDVHIQKRNLNGKELNQDTILYNV